MPYKSAKQRAFMHIHHPQIARHWDKKYGGKVVPTKNVSSGASKSFSGGVLSRALARRAGSPTAPVTRVRGGGITKTPAMGAPVKNMPSGRPIVSTRPVRGAPAPTVPSTGSTPRPRDGLRSIPQMPGSNMKPSKAMQGGNQLQTVARRAMRRRSSRYQLRPGAMKAR